MADSVNKNKYKTPVSSIKKQASAPIKSTNKILPKKKNTSTDENIFISTTSTRSLKSYIYDKMSGSNHTSSSCPRSSQSKLSKRFIDRSENVMKRNYETLFNELQEQHKDLTIEFTKSKCMTESLQEQLNKVKHDKEIQTCGIGVEQLENSLKNLANEKTLLNLELDLSNEALTNTKLDLDEKNEQLLTMSAQNSTLKSKIEVLNGKIDDLENTDSEKTIKIEKLFKEKNQLRNDFVEISRLRDEAAEETIELTNKYTNTKHKLFELRSKIDGKRNEVVQGSMRLSEQIDEQNKKQKQIYIMEDLISEHESLIKQLTLENRDHTITIAGLEADGVELRNDLAQWETRAGCWINTFVRDEYQSKIDDYEKEVQQLNIKNIELSDAYRNAVSKKCEQISEKEKIVEIKQSNIEQMKEIISLMRKINVHSSNDNQVREIVENCFLKFDNAMNRMQHFEDLVKENGRLLVIINEFKQRLKSNTYNELF